MCGYLVGGGEIKLDPEKLKAVKSWPEPAPNQLESLKTQVRAFIGFCNFYRDSIDHYSEIAEPLTTLTGEKTPWSWEQRHKDAWQQLKNKMCESPVVAAYDPELPVETHTDASDKSIGSAIHQRQRDGKTQPIAFFSKKLNAAQQNYPTHDKELLAIVETFRAHEPWMYASPKPVVVHSDHKALTHWMDASHTRSQRHMRWADYLLDHNFVIRHVAGRENRAADALSRIGGESGEDRENRAVLQPRVFEGFISTNQENRARARACVSRWDRPITVRGRGIKTRSFPSMFSFLSSSCLHNSLE
jgi:hypothetical protein